MTRILAISGSLRQRSRNTTLLEAVQLIAPDGVQIQFFQGLADLPHFNPDLEEHAPPSVHRFQTQLREADAIIISSPEYAHGVPGSLKNALDWVVGSGELVGKPVALLNASMTANIAQASLIETLMVMSANVIHEASLRTPIASNTTTALEVIERPDLAVALRLILQALLAATEKPA